ncbi:MAG: hypothetical protein OEZ65_02200 [Gemmatimonadota bacterium]|nr:hypothetical protein [Gemmatimonadota bacterium]MDH5758372.1 hypothetical protein [Gemmatimonadota bacterium]
MIRKKLGILATLAASTTWACSEQTPTSLEDAVFPGDIRTVEVELPWAQFGSGLEVLGGYGSPVELGSAVVAQAFAGTLDANTLVRFADYPDRATVRDTTGTSRTDSTLTFLSGRVVVFMDTIASTAAAPVTLALAELTQRWHPQTTDWTLAVDTLGDSMAWGEPGGGPVLPVGTAVWDPTAGDTVVFPVDSAQVAAWGDTTAVRHGARISLETPGERLHVRQVVLRLVALPSVNPDTLVDVTAGARSMSFIYDPSPLPPPDGIRVGGVPAWRSVLDIGVPAQLDGPPALCDAVGCPFPLTHDRVNYAALVLYSRSSDPAFQPTDSVGIDVRPVYDRGTLPKSPLGGSLAPTILGYRVGPGAFGSAPGQRMEIPLTGFVRAILLAKSDSTVKAPSPTLALLSPFEPVSLAFASFEGPGTPAAPVLKLILTAGRPVELP